MQADYYCAIIKGDMFAAMQIAVCFVESDPLYAGFPFFLQDQHLRKPLKWSMAFLYSLFHAPAKIRCGSQIRPCPPHPVFDCVCVCVCVVSGVSGFIFFFWRNSHFFSA